TVHHVLFDAGDHRADGITVENIVAAIAMDGVGVVFTEDQIVTVVAGQLVVLARAAIERRTRSVIAIDRVVVVFAGNGVGAFAAVNQIGVGSSNRAPVAIAAENKIVAGSALNRVVAVERIRAVTNDGVVVRAAVEGVISSTADNAIVARETENGV